MSRTMQKNKGCGYEINSHQYIAGYGRAITEMTPRRDRHSGRQIAQATALAILLMLIAAYAASAAMVTYEFSGAVRSTTNNVDQYLPVVIGDPIFGVFTVDLDQDTTEVTGKVVYTDPIVDFSLTVGGDHFQFVDTTTSSVILKNNLSPPNSSKPVDSIQVIARGLEGDNITLHETILTLRDFGTMRLIDDLSLNNLADIPFIEHNGIDLHRLAGINITSRERLNVDWLTLERTAFIEDPPPPPLFGDANGDGMVTAYDLNVIGLNWQRSGDWRDGDFTGDGFVDSADLNQLGINWQAGTPRAPLSVPEPGTLALLLVGSVWALRREFVSP